MPPPTQNSGGTSPQPLTKGPWWEPCHSNACAKRSIHDSIDDEVYLISSSDSRRFLVSFLNMAKTEKPILQRYVVAKGIRASVARL